MAPVAVSTADRLEHEQNIMTVFQISAPATVHIALERPAKVEFGDIEMMPGSGTGFIWDTHGHIITNYHVVDSQDAQEFFVTLYNQKTYKAKLLGGDRNKDVAVLELEDNNESLTAIGIPPAGAPLHVGQTAIAIGNPFGLDHTLTVGVVSALGRDVPGYGGVTIRGMIQTDASINPGNSGGPLLDSQGLLVGMNTMIMSRSSGIGFAVPVDTIRRVATQIISKGHVDHPGIGAVPLPDYLTARIGVKGVLLKTVLPDSPADRAGIRGVHQGEEGLDYGDIIVGIDDVEVLSYDSLYNALDAHSVGDVVTVHVRRNGKPLRLKVTLVDLGES
jgi:S1-C subfamily serine protease